VVVVQPGTRVVLATPTAPGASPRSNPPDTVYVQPGDVVVVGSPGQTPRPDQTYRNLLLNDRRDVPAAQLEPPEYEQLSLNRTVSHIPTGFAYALLAPFPWQVGRLADALTIPEVLLWYLCVIAGLATLWIRRQQWWALLPIFAYISLMFGFFVFFEANTGTLFRHRAMLMPYAIALASPTLLRLWPSLRAR
jgi:hypothetical protein